MMRGGDEVRKIAYKPKNSGSPVRSVQRVISELGCEGIHGVSGGGGNAEPGVGDCVLASS